MSSSSLLALQRLHKKNSGNWEKIVLLFNKQPVRLGLLLARLHFCVSLHAFAHILRDSAVYCAGTPFPSPTQEEGRQRTKKAMQHRMASLRSAASASAPTLGQNSTGQPQHPLSPSTPYSPSAARPHLPHLPHLSHLPHGGPDRAASREPDHGQPHRVADHQPDRP